MTRTRLLTGAVALVGFMVLAQEARAGAADSKKGQKATRVMAIDDVGGIGKVTSKARAGVMAIDDVGGIGKVTSKARAGVMAIDDVGGIGKVTSKARAHARRARVLRRKVVLHNHKPQADARRPRVLRRKVVLHNHKPQGDADRAKGPGLLRRTHAYKGKGIRFKAEIIRRKAGKAAGK